MWENSRWKCSEIESQKHTVLQLFTLWICVSARRLKDKPPRRNRLKKNNSLVKQFLRRFRGCLIRKVQKSSNKLPASSSRESTSAVHGTEKKTKAVKPEKETETLAGVIFRTSHRQSVVWRGLTSPSTESAQGAHSESHVARTHFYSELRLCLTQFRFSQFLQGWWDVMISVPACWYIQ